MKQSKTMSFVESCANVGIGYLVAVLSNIFILPIFGFEVSMRVNLVIALIYTIISLVRSFAVRRIFESIRENSYGRKVV